MEPAGRLSEIARFARSRPFRTLLFAGATAALAFGLVRLFSPPGPDRSAAVPPAATIDAAAHAATPTAQSARSGPHHRPVPILMYHVITAPPPQVAYPELYVLPADFRAQMHWLQVHGYHAVTLDQVDAYWRRGTPLPKKPIVLSFDDGYRGDYVNAAPVLSALGWPGVLNLELAHIGKFWGLSKRQLRGLIADGWEVDSHTITHPDLTTLGAAALEREVAGSRAQLRAMFGVPANFFCYPSGRYDAAVVAAVRAAGYRGATTVRDGLARPSERFTLDRIRVNGSDGVRGLAGKLVDLGA